MPFNANNVMDGWSLVSGLVGVGLWSYIIRSSYKMIQNRFLKLLGCRLLVARRLQLVVRSLRYEESKRGLFRFLKNWHDNYGR